MFKRNKKAFTMIEMSMVVIILSLFFSTIILGGKKTIFQSRLAAAKALTQSSPVKDIDNLAMWLETTLSKNFIKSELASNSISTWYDLNEQLSVLHNATSAASGNNPTYVENAMSGLPVLNFNGVDDYLNFDGRFLVGSDYTIFVVEQRRSGSGANYFIGGGSGFTNSALHLGYRSNQTPTFAQYGNDLDYTNGLPTYSSPVPRIHSYKFSNASGKFYFINGVLVAPKTDAGGKTAMVAYANAKIAQNWSNNYYNGDIGEIIMFTRALSDFERQEIEKYLSKKWLIKII